MIIDVCVVRKFNFVQQILYYLFWINILDLFKRINKRRQQYQRLTSLYSDSQGYYFYIKQSNN